MSKSHSSRSGAPAEEYEMVPNPESIHNSTPRSRNHTRGESSSQSILISDDGDNLKDGDETPRKFVKEKLGIATILTDVGSVLCPLALLVFSFMVLRTNGRDKDEAYAKYRNAITVLGTIFPIIFASIMGRLMYQIARWKLEKGATMGTLEQLMGSRTLGSTFLTQIQLGSYNLLGFSLLLVWVFSPFGGQSLLRMLDLRLSTVVHSSNIIRFDSEAQSNFADWTPGSASGAASTEEWLSILDSMYNALLLSPDSVKYDSMDLWTNLKIPMLQSYGNESSEWQQVPRVGFEYSALVGFPLTNVSKGNTSFSIETSYVQLECAKPQKIDFEDGGEIPLNVTGFGSLPEPVPNGTWYGLPLNGTTDAATWNLGLDTFVDTIWRNFSFYDDRGIEKSQTERPGMFTNETGIEAGPTKLLFQAELSDNPNSPPDHVNTTCGVSQKYVESWVTCSRTNQLARPNCTVVEQRDSQKPHSPENISQLSFPLIFSYISGRLPRATNHRSTNSQADLSLNYIQNPSVLDVGKLYTQKSRLALENVTEEVFSYRLGQLINTYLILSQVFIDTPSGSTDPNASFEPNITLSVDVENIVEVYHISKPWIAACIVSCFLLLISAVLGVVFIHLADGPEVLGYVSTVVRDSKYLDMPSEAGRMNGIDLTNSMKERRVQYGLTHLAQEGQSLMGVGRQEDIGKINS
ncbi:Fc.00g032370.m01.CDS01 [Cosmosporella sp. VM-42]